MKSDGMDQMNTVAKTAEYPLDRWELRCDGASRCGGDILEFISALVRPRQRMHGALSSADLIRVLRATRWSVETADTTASPIRAPKLWDGLLHKFSGL
jgi:hypothetical protein